MPDEENNIQGVNPDSDQGGQDVGSLSPEEIQGLMAERQQLQARLKQANQESAARRHEIKQLQEKVKQFDSVDVSEYLELKAKHSQHEDEELKSQEKYQELLQKRQREFEAQIQTHAKDAAAARQELENMRRKVYIENAAVQAAQKVDAYDPAAVAKIVGDRVELTKTDTGNYRAVIPNEFDPDDGTPLTIERKIELMAKDRENSWMFKPRQPQGAGSNGSSPSGAQIPQSSVVFKSPEEAAAYARNHPEKWDELLRTGAIQNAFRR